MSTLTLEEKAKIEKLEKWCSDCKYNDCDVPNKWLNSPCHECLDAWMGWTKLTITVDDEWCGMKDKVSLDGYCPKYYQENMKKN